ncbi:MAG: amidase [Myxococcaceae bacterium]|nr:amidase [Myxococcaceae bacterium]
MPVDAQELAAWDAVETAERIAKRDVSPLEVVDAAIARAEAAKHLNAVVTPSYEKARRATEVLLDAPLSGVPTFTKDLVQVAGLRTAWGTASSGEFISKKNDPSVKRLESTGLVSLGKSATPEFGLTGTTEPVAFGPTHNPWALGHTPGGSSGGAAALVAAGVVPIAHASDGGGSIRIPAACCGLVGLKATRGRFDMEGSNLLPVNVAVHGCVSRTVRDTVAFWQALELGVPSKKYPPVGSAAKRPAQRVKVAMFTASPVKLEVDPEVKGAVEKTAKLLRELGHEVHEIDCPVPEDISVGFVSLWSYLAWLQPNGGLFIKGSNFDKTKLDPLTQAFAKRFTSRVWATFGELRRLRTWTQRFEQAFQTTRADVWLCPTLGTLPPKHGHLSTTVPVEEALNRLYAYCPFTGFYNTSGAPALSLPLFQSASGLPIGVQLGTTRGRDALLLELGAELEAAKPWPLSAPAR